MRIGLTGTPGVGKSTIAALLREQGASVIDLNEWATAHDAISGTDADGTKVIDTDRIDVDGMPDPCIVDSHMAHTLPVDAIWLLRCDPRILRERLSSRGYTDSKVQENVEAEAMDLILQEAMDSGIPVVQRDGTRRTPSESLSAFQEVTTEALKSSDLEPVDWSDALLDGF